MSTADDTIPTDPQPQEEQVDIDHDAKAWIQQQVDKEVVNEQGAESLLKEDNKKLIAE